MKVVKLQDLKAITDKEPIYSVLGETPQKNGDPRAIGCCPLAFLNLAMLAKKRMGISSQQTAHEILFDEVLPFVDEQEDLGVPFESAMSFIDKSPLFNGWKALVLNPSGMNAEVFWLIALRRLLNGDIALCILEVPDKAGDEAKKSGNHLSVLHSEDGEIYYDGVRMTKDALANILWFSPINTVMFFGKPAEAQDG